MVTSKKAELEKLNLIGQKFSFISQKGNEVSGTIAKIVDDAQFITPDKKMYRFEQIQAPFDLVMKLIEVDNKVKKQLREVREKRESLIQSVVEKYYHEYWFDAYLETVVKCGYELPMFREFLKSLESPFDVDFQTMLGGNMKTTFIPLLLGINGVFYEVLEDENGVDYVERYTENDVTIDIQTDGFVFVSLGNFKNKFLIDGYYWYLYFEKDSKDNKEFEKFNSLQKLILTNSII